MNAPANCALVGCWRIVAADIWDRGHLDLRGPATITRLTVSRQSLLRRGDAKPLSIVFDSRQARTARLAQSMTATRYRKPRAIGI